METQIKHFIKNVRYAIFLIQRIFLGRVSKLQYRPAQRVAPYLIYMKKESMRVYVAINYFTRFVIAKPILNKKADIVKNMVE